MVGYCPKNFNKIVDYLLKEWTVKEVEKFVRRTEERLAILEQYPEMSQPSLKRRNARIIILNKHTKLIYRYKPGDKQLLLLLSWGHETRPC